MDRIRSCDDNERLNHIIDIFAQQRMSGKRYETKMWRTYFRRITIDTITFYQHNTAIFDHDCMHDNKQWELSATTFIHGDLHVGQFLYYFCDVGHERVFEVQKYTRKAAPITQDLKRLAVNIALIAYYQGFNDIEIMEVLEKFTRQYIKRVLLMEKSCLKKAKCIEDDQAHRVNSQRLQKQSSIIGLQAVPHQLNHIDWRSIDTVKSLMILSEQLAIATAHLHCQPPVTISFLKDMTESTMKTHTNHCTRTLQAALSSLVQQQRLVGEVCSFAMVYADIAERDHRLFFKNFRNETMFRCITTLQNAHISRPLTICHREAILIVGGGIGGMAVALSFAQAGIPVKLIEKNPEFAEVGAGMQLAPNCSRLLDRLGILQQVQTNAVFPKQIVWMDAINGDRLTCIDLGAKFVETFGYPYIVVHRGDLLHALHQACLATGMVRMEANRTVTNVDERPESLMVQCVDGTRYDCDMVIGADGLWSALRKFVYDDGPPISVGYVTFRGTVGIEQVSKEAGLENVQFWIGPDIHLVQYPIRRGELFNQAAVFRSNRLPDGTDQWGTKEELNERFSVGCQHVKNALPLLQTNFRWPVYESVVFIWNIRILSIFFFLSSRNPLSTWSRGRLVLLGDAAHPMLQYAAQGAAQVLEDACALTDAYKKHGPAKIKEVFREYEEKRIPRSSKVVQFARDIGTFAHHNGMAKILRDAILRQHDMNNYDCVKWLYADN